MISLGKRNSQFPKVYRRCLFSLSLLFCFFFLLASLTAYPKSSVYDRMLVHTLVLGTRSNQANFILQCVFLSLCSLAFSFLSNSSREFSSHVLKWTFLISEAWLILSSTLGRVGSHKFHFSRKSFPVSSPKYTAASTQKHRHEYNKNNKYGLSRLTLAACSALFSRNSLWWFSR